MSAIDGITRSKLTIEQAKRQAQIGWLHDRLQDVILRVGETSIAEMNADQDPHSLRILEMEVEALCDKKRKTLQKLELLIQNRESQELQLLKKLAEERNHELQFQNLKTRFEGIMANFHATRQKNLLILNNLKRNQQAFQESAAVKWEKVKLINSTKVEVQKVDSKIVNSFSAVNDLLNLETEANKLQTKPEITFESDEEAPRKIRPKSQQPNPVELEKWKEENGMLQNQLASLRHSNSVIEEGIVEPDELESAISIITKLNRRLQYRIDRHAKSQHKKTASQLVVN